MTSLTSTSLHRLDAQVEVRFAWDGTVAYEESVLWSLFARDEQGRLRQLGYKQVADETFQFVFDHNSARQTNVWVSSSLTDNERSVRFNIIDLTGANLEALT